jgi:spore maturation protein SpmA
MINSILYKKNNELQLIDFCTEKLVPLGIKALESVKSMNEKCTKTSLVLCGYTEKRGAITIHPVHCVDIASGQKGFDLAKLSLEDIVTIGYKGAITLQKAKTKQNDQNIESGFD